MHLSPLDTHVGLLIRTWTRYSEPGQPRPHAEQGVYVRDSGFTRGTGGTAVHQTHYITRGPAIPNPGHLIRTRTRYSKPGLPHPHVNPLFRTRASSPTCGTEGLPAEQGAQPYTRPTTSHANPLFRAWATPPTCGTAGLPAEQGVYVRNSNGRSRMGPPVLHACAPLTSTVALRVSDAGRRRSLRGSCPWRGRRGLPQVPRRRCPRASRPKR